MAAADQLYAYFPWLAQLGLESQIRQWLADGLEGEALLGALRKTPQYQQAFPWIKRSDGTMRMNESQYLQTQDSYRQLFRQYGFEPPKNPMEYGAFFNGEVSPQELKDRMETYRNIERSGREVREAFYIYAGKKVTTDDLYRAVIDPGYGQQLQDEYNQRVAAQPLDYQTWVTRAAEVGLQRVVDSLTQLQREGVVTGPALERVRGINPEFAKQMMDVLYHGGDPMSGDYMSSLDELMATFEEALIGGASSQAGLGLPDKERVRQLRAAGVTRAQALKSYSDFGSRKNLIGAAAQRAGGYQFGGREFESQEFLGDAEQKSILNSAMAQEAALGKGGGGVDVQIGREGQLAQTGFRAARF